MEKIKNLHINTDKIRGLIVEKKLSNRLVSKKLGITVTSLMRRLRSERDFTADEIAILSSVLNEPVNIFFR